MALKDWKQIVKRRELYLYNKKDETNQITINSLNREWNVFIGFRPHMTQSKFKNKPLALKFAKSYMRKH